MKNDKAMTGVPGQATQIQADSSNQSPASGTRRWAKVPAEDDPKRLVWEWQPEALDDLDELFSRIGDDSASDEDHEFFDASMIDRFISRVYDNEQVEPWIMSRMAEALYKVMMGGDWNDELLLPGRPTTQIRPWRDQRDLEIFCDVSNAINLHMMKVTEAITWAAEQHTVSFETARSGYYRWKEQLSKKPEKP
jgi:hypothetical protein